MSMFLFPFWGKKEVKQWKMAHEIFYRKIYCAHTHTTCLCHKEVNALSTAANMPVSMFPNKMNFGVALHTPMFFGGGLLEVFVQRKIIHPFKFTLYQSS